MASPSPAFLPDQALQLLDHLASQIRRTIKRPDERHVHDLRVAIRRFHQAVSILKPHLNPENYKDMGATLKGILPLAGEARNCDVTVKLLGKMKERPPVQIGRHRRQCEKALVAALQSFVQQDFAAQWQIQLQPCRELSAPAARKLLLEGTARAARRVHKRSSDIHKSFKALHKLRIAAKKLRYALELSGAPVEPVKDLQTQLGDINDYRSAARLLKAIDGTSALRTRLAKKQRKKVRRFRREFKEPAPAAHRSPPHA